MKWKWSTHSLSSFVQFPIKLGICPDIPFPSILLQAVNKDDEYLNSKGLCKPKMLEPYNTTYNSVKFFRFPIFFGIVPVKLFEDRALYNEETVS